MFSLTEDPPGCRWRGSGGRGVRHVMALLPLVGLILAGQAFAGIQTGEGALLQADETAQQGLPVAQAQAVQEDQQPAESSMSEAAIRKAVEVAQAEGKKEEKKEKKKEEYLSPEGQPLQSPFEIIRERPEIKRRELGAGEELKAGAKGYTYGESLLRLGVGGEFAETERDLIGAQVKTFIPPLLTPAVGQHAFVLPPKLFQASVDFGFTNLSGNGFASGHDFDGAFGVGNFGGVRRQFTTFTLGYGFDLGRKYLHSFTAVLVVPWLATQARGFAEPAGFAGPHVFNGGTYSGLGDIGVLIKKKITDQANFPIGISMLGGLFLPTGHNTLKVGANGDGQVFACRGAGSPPPPLCNGAALPGGGGIGTTVFERFTQDGRFPSFLQTGTGGLSYLTGFQFTRQFLPGHFLPAIFSGTPFDRMAIHGGALHKFNFKHDGVNPGDQTILTGTMVMPVFKDYLSLDVTDITIIQSADSYSPFLCTGACPGLPVPGTPGNTGTTLFSPGPATRGIESLLGPSLIFSPDPIMRFRVTSLFRVHAPALGPAPPYLINFGMDVIF